MEDELDQEASEGDEAEYKELNTLCETNLNDHFATYENSPKDEEGEDFDN